MTSSPPLIRFAHPMAFQSFLRKMGAPVDRCLRHNCLPALCEDPDVFVPVIKVWAFFDEESRKEDQLLGWDAGEYVGDHSLNTNLLRKLENAPTLLSALRRLVRLVRSEGSDIDIGILERSEDILLYTHYWGLRDMPGYHISQAYQLSVFLDLIRFFLGRDWYPDEIGLEAAEIPPDLKKRFPGPEILPHQPLGYIVIPRRFLHHSACHTVSPGAGKEGPLTIRSFDYIDTLSSLVRSYLSEGYVSEKLAAELMDTSVRTLKRKLAVSGTSYSKLLDEIRFNVAREYLQRQDMRLIDVAQSTGFRDQANFTRMFRRLSGITPGHFRKLIRSESAGLVH